jgi:hypothetical protein
MVSAATNRSKTGVGGRSLLSSELVHPIARAGAGATIPARPLEDPEPGFGFKKILSLTISLKTRLRITYYTLGRSISSFRQGFKMTPTETDDAAGGRHEN